MAGGTRRCNGTVRVCPDPLYSLWVICAGSECSAQLAREVGGLVLPPAYPGVALALTRALPGAPANGAEDREVKTRALAAGTPIKLFPIKTLAQCFSTLPMLSPGSFFPAIFR